MKEVKAKKTEELKVELSHLREQLRELRFKVSQNQHKDVRDVRVAKRTISRYLTELTKRSHAKS